MLYVHMYCGHLLRRFHQSPERENIKTYVYRPGKFPSKRDFNFEEE